MFFVPMSSMMVNYVDDNLVCYKNKSTQVLCEVLRLNTKMPFEQNYMNVNPNKFQGINLGKDVPQSIALTA